MCKFVKKISYYIFDSVKMKMNVKSLSAIFNMKNFKFACDTLSDT